MVDITLATKIILGIVIAVIGGKLGLTKLLFITIAGISGYISFIIVKSFWKPLASRLALLMPWDVAVVMTAIILTLTPLLLVFLGGRRLMVKIGIKETISQTIDSTLGAGYAVTAYFVFCHIFWRR